MKPPRTSYTNVGDSAVAYQVFGEGPIDVVFVTGFPSNVDVQWDVPRLARFLERVASYSRVIMFDQRGVGNSDRLPLDALPTWEDWAEDLTAVLDAAGSERAAIVATAEAGAWGMLFAATHPDRTTALVLWNAFAKFLKSDDFPWGMEPDFAASLATMVETAWGTEDLARAFNPSLADDPAEAAAVARFNRSAVTPRAAAAMFRYFSHTDARDVLSLIRVPTLVMRRAGLFGSATGLSQHLADNIAGARFVQVPGTDLAMMFQVGTEIEDLLEEHLTGLPVTHDDDRSLATVLFTDIVGSTERAAAIGDRAWRALLDEHERCVRTQVDRHRGRVVQMTGDGMLATFDGPGKALRCAVALRTELSRAGLDVRAGAHTGEIEQRGDDVGGIAVHIAARVMAAADDGAIFCSRTVKDLVAGGGFTFADRGAYDLKGVPDSWQLYELRS